MIVILISVLKNWSQILTLRKLNALIFEIFQNVVLVRAATPSDSRVFSSAQTSTGPNQIVTSDIWDYIWVNYNISLT